MKRLTVLGSTGSIGRNTLHIVSMFPERFQIKALAAKSRIDLLAEQVHQFRPETVVVYNATIANDLKALLDGSARVDILHGPEGYEAAAARPDVDMVVAAMMGAAGLTPTLAAINSGKDIALANKETLVMAGDIVMGAARAQNVRILPVDSEHSAIFQCLSGQRKQDLDKILLTASGGPFRRTPAAELADVTPERALDHPNWSMGHKITIDSATLMNKGLEVLEAKSLFNVETDQIEVVVHPQSIIHSMVAYADGSVIAQLGVPDMKGAIAYALSYPERMPIRQPLPDFTGGPDLTFESPDLDRFPCLALAFEACKTGQTLPAVLNAANEVVVEAFLGGHIGFLQIPEIIRSVMSAHTPAAQPTLQQILDADRWARQEAGRYVKPLP
ncbi:1-deoxy-D-xylulose 5-phosphate reductoisomerase (EC [Olavius algarvensis associated proteobacterium Delta 3]|nr:1-deoxy-D-xylulose 5-phosphate reductoisomerase (EC [Olavius algarvensis associated proteobacterium Delta 3]